jgi:hypothetical protein
MNKKGSSGQAILFIIAVVIILLLVSKSQTPSQPTPYSKDSISIVSWNLQRFGDNKSSNSELLNKYFDVLKNYDIIFIQEITKLCNKFLNYNCYISSRAGNTNYKEQYGVIYKQDIVSTFQDYNPGSASLFERPPLRMNINIYNYSLTIFNVHLKPDNVDNELNNLYDAVPKSGNVLVSGDLNADCDYYNNIVSTQFDSWYWLIQDNEDTTVGVSNCAYDRFISSQDAFPLVTETKIITEGITLDMSDHYPIMTRLTIIK